MNRKEFQELQDYYKKAEAVKKQIDDISKFIRGVNSRKKNGAKSYSLSIHSRKVGAYDLGVNIDLTVETVHQCVLPALRAKAKELREEYKQLKGVEIK